MSKFVEMNYYNGSSYEVFYPQSFLQEKLEWTFTGSQTGVILNPKTIDILPTLGILSIRNSGGYRHLTSTFIFDPLWTDNGTYCVGYSANFQMLNNGGNYQYVFETEIDFQIRQDLNLAKVTIDFNQMPIIYYYFNGSNGSTPEYKFYKGKALDTDNPWAQILEAGNTGKLLLLFSKNQNIT